MSNIMESLTRYPIESCPTNISVIQSKRIKKTGKQSFPSRMKRNIVIKDIVSMLGVQKNTLKRMCFNAYFGKPFVNLTDDEIMAVVNLVMKSRKT